VEADLQVDSEDVLRLTHRLEELLDELQHSDQRVHDLEELLRLSDHANQAEQDERHQLENWIQEIERRVSQRDSETDAELARLQNRNAELQSQLQQAEAQIRNLMNPIGGGKAANQVSRELFLELRNRYDQLTERLRAALEEIQRLQQEQVEGRNASESERKQLEQKMLEIELNNSRERAEIARQRAELQRTRDEIECRLRSSTETSDADRRFAAMRQHLRELHEEDKLAREEKRLKGLSGRIANLLNRSRT
jgi:hypothetical protein